MSDFPDAEREKTSAGRSDESPGGKTEPASQALLDLKASGLTREDMDAAARASAEEAKKKTRPDPPIALPRFRWLILLILSAAGSLALAWSGEESLENFRLGGLAGIILLLLLMSALPKARLFPRLPTRGGLAAALFSAAIFIQTLRGQPEAFFQICPTTLVWAGLLTLTLIWTAAAATRKLGRRLLIALAVLFLVYAALGPVMALISHFSPDGPKLTWETLNASPAFLTKSLPWPLWPMALTLGLALPLAALLALGDQWSALRRAGARHGGNFFLALAWLGLMFSGLLLFTPAAAAYPDLVKKIRDLAPILAGAETTPAAVPALMPPPPPADQEAPAAPEAEDILEEDLFAEPAPPSEEAKPAEPADSEGSPAAAPDDLAARLEEMQLRVNDLEGRLQLLNDRLNHLERPEQPRNPATPLPPDAEAPPNMTDQPQAAPPGEGGRKNERKRYHGGSAT